MVLSLLAGKLDNGHSIYMDNFYNSVKLTKEPLKRKTYVTGTLRSNRKENPSETVKKLKKGEMVVRYNSEGICVVKWREILAISSEYNARMQNITTQRGQQKEKLNLINEYIKCMTGEHKTL